MKTYKFRKEITSGDIEAIMSSALQGMTYWAGEVELKQNVEVDMYMSEVLTNGYDLRVYDFEGGRWHTLTMKKFLKGLAMMNKYDYYEYDMYDCEQVIQYALFGEQRYA